jgi:hypothetical protein
MANLLIALAQHGRSRTAGLGSCEAARMLADDITRETADFSATLKGAARQALGRRLDFLKPCSPSATADKTDEQKKNSQDHNKAIKDAIRKMIEQIAEVNRATHL